VFVWNNQFDAEICRARMSYRITDLTILIIRAAADFTQLLVTEPGFTGTEKNAAFQRRIQ